MGREGLEKAPATRKNLGDLMARVGLLFTGVYGLGQGFQLWAKGAVFAHHDMMVFSLLTYLAGFTCLALAALYTPRLRRAVGWVVGGVVLFATFARGYNHLRYVNPQYGTDAVAFNHYAAELTLKGANPYEASMAAASTRFGVPKKYYTPDDRGQVVHELSYPAQSFLVYAPFVALGVKNVNWVNLGAHLLVILLLVLLSPEWVRPLSPLVLLFEPEFVNFTVGGVTDICFLPLLLAAAYAWRSHKSLTAILWGLACGIKQGPWFLAPFLFVALYHETSRKAGDSKPWWREELQFFGLAAAAFLLPNLPFFFSSPSAWFGGVFTPMGRKLVLYGSGLVNLTTSAGVPLPRTAYTLLALAVWSGLVALYSLFYRRLAPALWIFPGAILWLTPRAFHSYYMYWAPVFMVALAWWLDDGFRSSEAPPDPAPEPDLPPSKGEGLEPDSAAEIEADTEADTGADTEPHSEPGHEPDDESEGEPAEEPHEQSEDEPTSQEKNRGLVSRVKARLQTPAGAALLLGLPFLLFGAAAVWAAASNETLEAQVLEVHDPKKLGVVEHLEIQVTNATDHATTPRFAVLWRGNNLFFWKVRGGLRELQPGERRVFHLHPRNHNEAPPLEEPFRIRVYDEATSLFHLTPVSGPHPRTALVYNRHLDHFDEVSGAPLRWTRTPRAVNDPGAVFRATVDGRKATCIRARQDGNTEWSRTALSQEVPPGVRTLSFTYASKHEPRGGGEPTQLLGLELELPRGEVVVFSPWSKTSTPIAHQRGRHLYVKLPYKKPGRWERFRLDTQALARHFRYAYTPALEVRILANRHRKLKGEARVCVEEISGSPNLHPRAFSTRDLLPLDNPSLALWSSSPRRRPLGWSVEPPPRGVPHRVGRDGPAGLSLEIGAKQPSSSPNKSPNKCADKSSNPSSKAPEWRRLAVSQRLLKTTEALEAVVCAPAITQDPHEPKLFVGLEITHGDTTHVWTLAKVKRARVVKKGRVHIHALPTRLGQGCTTMKLDLRSVGRPGAKVSLLLNVHRSLQGRHEVRFGPLKIR